MQFPVLGRHLLRRGSEGKVLPRRGGKPALARCTEQAPLGQ